MDAEHRTKAREMIDKGIAFLLTQRDENGGWSVGNGTARPAITAMVLKVLVQDPNYGPNHPTVKEGFNVLLSYQQKDGGIYTAGGGAPASYTSAVALMTLASAKNPEYKDAINKLVTYLKSLQIVPGSGSSDTDKIADDDPRVGGVSYGPRGRPDLSNVGMWTQALHDANVDPNDPAVQRAVGFISRMQDNSETNSMAWAAKEGNNDGGFVYVMPARENPGSQGRRGGRGGGPRGVRIYGSMTYTGFKSLLYAGVDRNDPRIQAAFNWIRNHWRLDSNPNMPAARSQAGVFYYYQVFAKAMRLWGKPIISDRKGVEHNWRKELVDELAKRIQKNGSWVNKADRWWEGYPVLTTCYAVLALQEAEKPALGNPAKH